MGQEQHWWELLSQWFMILRVQVWTVLSAVRGRPEWARHRFALQPALSSDLYTLSAEARKDEAGLAVTKLMTGSQDLTQKEAGPLFPQEKETGQILGQRSKSISIAAPRASAPERPDTKGLHVPMLHHYWLAKESYCEYSILMIIKSPFPPIKSKRGPKGKHPHHRGSARGSSPLPACKAPRGWCPSVSSLCNIAGVPAGRGGTMKQCL